MEIITTILVFLGIKPIAKAAGKVIEKGGIETIETISAVCKPVATEYGHFLQDKVHAWRAKNLTNVVQYAFPEGRPPNGTIHPRIAAKVLENGSWTDDDTLQKMWGGLFASSCTPNPSDDSNIIFVDILAQLTSLQVKILNYACITAKKKLIGGNLQLIQAEILSANIDHLIAITGVHDAQRLDREMDHLRGKGLISNGFIPSEEACIAIIAPTGLALHLYARCHGFLGHPADYFGIPRHELPEQSAAPIAQSTAK